MLFLVGIEYSRMVNVFFFCIDWYLTFCTASEGRETSRHAVQYVGFCTNKTSRRGFEGYGAGLASRLLVRSLDGKGGCIRASTLPSFCKRNDFELKPFYTILSASNARPPATFLYTRPMPPHDKIVQSWLPTYPPHSTLRLQARSISGLRFSI